MNILIQLPSEDLHQEEVDRLRRRIEMKFCDAPLGQWAADADWTSSFADLLPDVDIDIKNDQPGFEGVDILVRVNPTRAEEDEPQTGDHRVYDYWTLYKSNEKKDRLELIHPAEYDAFENPHIDAHIFNRLSSRQYGFVNFPFGSLYMDPGVGPINPFGFRIDHDFADLVDRPPHHKVVAVFGGSAAFSLYCQYDEMFAKLLEEKLNTRFENTSPRLTFTVLNFGMHDHVVLQETITWLMYAQSVRPDYVITHSGHNDVWYGLRNDPVLVTHHNIIYQQHFEGWSHILHRSSDEPAAPKLPLELNLPQNVLKACIARHDQFRINVENSGGVFIWGLQPTIYSRTRQHPNEKKIIDHLESVFQADPHRRKYYQRISILIEKLSNHLSTVSSNVIDFHKIFDEFGDENELMWDHVHTSPMGDQVIAEHYENVIAKKLNY